MQKNVNMHGLVIVLLCSPLGLSISVQDEQSFVQIPCPARVEAGLQYRKISWYKVVEGSDELIGLVIKDFRTNETVLYKFANQSYEVGSDYSLLVPDAGERDCGHYRCTLWPPLGHYIQDGDYEFYKFGCSKPLQRSKPLTGEKTRLYVNYIPLSLTVSGVFASAIMAIAFLSYQKKKFHNKAKHSKVYFCEEQSVDCNGNVGSSVKSV